MQIGRMGIGTTTPASGTQLLLKDGSLELRDSDVAHGMTNFYETDIFGQVKINHSGYGGLHIVGVSDGSSGGLTVRSVMGSNDPADSIPHMVFDVWKKDSGGTGTTYLANAEAAFQFQNGSSGKVTITGNGYIGLGYLPEAPIHINHAALTDGSVKYQQIISSIASYNASPVAGLIFHNRKNSDMDRAGMGGITVGKENTTNDNVAGYMAFHTRVAGGDNTERMRITSAGKISIGATLENSGAYSSTYHIDTSPAAQSIVNGGTVDFSSFSGMIIANNHGDGMVTVYICGGGTVVIVSNTGLQVGTLVYNSGIAGYRWTANYGSTQTYGFCCIRTRATA